MKDFKYAEKVAISWKEKSIETVDQARNCLTNYDKPVYEIMNRLGKTGIPTAKDLEFINDWRLKDGFSDDVIMEACDRAFLSNDKNRFSYANGILSKWKEQNIHSLEDIKRIIKNNKKIENNEFTKKKRGRKNTHKTKKEEHNKKAPDNIRKKIKNHFHKFIFDKTNQLIKNFYGNQKFTFKKGIHRIKNNNNENENNENNYNENDKIFFTNDISLKTNKKLINTNIEDFLKQKISSRYTKYEKNENKKIFEEKLNKNFIMQNNYVFKMKYKEFFINFYLNDNYENKNETIEKENNLNENENSNKNKKPENFKFLLNKNKENKDYYEKLKEIGYDYIKYFDR